MVFMTKLLFKFENEEVIVPFANKKEAMEFKCDMEKIMEKYKDEVINVEISLL